MKFKVFKKMKKIIAIDLRYAENPYTGLTRFSKNIFLNLIKFSARNNCEYHLILPPIQNSQHLKEFSKYKSKNIKIIYWNALRGIKWKFPFFLIDINLLIYCISRKVTLFVSPYIDPPLLPFINVISTIHDLTFITVRDYFQSFKTFKRYLSELRIILTLIYSNRILTVSESTKYFLKIRYQKVFPFLSTKLNNICVVSNGINKEDHKRIRLDSKRIPNLPRNYFLYVGDRRPHKNLNYLIDLIKSIRNNGYDYKLVLAGSNQYKNFSLERKIKKNKNFIFEFLLPTDDELNFLYKNTKALFLISLSEGFGIPVIEAALRGTKVVVSNFLALQEIAPKNSLILEIGKEKSHLNQVIKYINSDYFPNPEEVYKSWNWLDSSKKLAKLLDGL